LLCACEFKHKTFEFEKIKITADFLTVKKTLAKLTSCTAQNKTALACCTATAKLASALYLKHTFGHINTLLSSRHILAKSLCQEKNTYLVLLKHFKGKTCTCHCCIHIARIYTDANAKIAQFTK
jgi:hypothetical protein